MLASCVNMTVLSVGKQAYSEFLANYIESPDAELPEFVELHMLLDNVTCSLIMILHIKTRK